MRSARCSSARWFSATRRRALQYGQDETRDVAGFVERIGPNRWRLVMPQPHFESQLDVMELVPSPKECVDEDLPLLLALAAMTLADPRRRRRLCPTRSAPTCRS